MGSSIKTSILKTSVPSSPTLDPITIVPTEKFLTLLNYDITDEVRKTNLNNLEVIGIVIGVIVAIIVIIIVIVMIERKTCQSHEPDNYFEYAKREELPVI